jgi:hypothetical protein
MSQFEVFSQAWDITSSKPIQVNSHKPAVKRNIYFEVINDQKYLLDEYISEYAISELKKVLDFQENGDSITFIIPKEKARYKYTVPKVQMCAYHATEDYLKSLLGVTLSYEDQVWFASHPLVNEMGLPQKYTVTVLSDLVKPYGIGISNIYVVKGSAINEELIKWQAVLGCNPKAKQSSQYSNADYIQEISGGNEELIKTFSYQFKDKFNFEYVDTPVMPAVVFTTTGSVNLSFAGGGGHSSYCAPRARIHNANWKLAIRFDRLDKIQHKYKQEPPTYKHENKLNVTLDIYNCLDKFNNKLATKLLNHRYISCADININTYNKINSSNIGSTYYYPNNTITTNKPTKENQRKSKRKEMNISKSEIIAIQNILSLYEVDKDYLIEYNDESSVINLINANLDPTVIDISYFEDEAKELITKIANQIKKEGECFSECKSVDSLDKASVNYIYGIIEDTVVGFKPINLLHILAVSNFFRETKLEQNHTLSPFMLSLENLIISVLIVEWSNDLLESGTYY